MEAYDIGYVIGWILGNILILSPIVEVIYLIVGVIYLIVKAFRKKK